MATQNPRVTVLVILLSFGFVSFAPNGTSLIERRISSKCADPTEKSGPASAPGLSLGLISFLGDSNSRRSAEGYSLFLRQMEVSSFLSRMNANMGMANYMGRTSMFPSYAQPNIANYQVDLKRPDASSQIFGGLMTNPALSYLINPKSDSANKIKSIASANNIGPVQVNATLSLTSGNNINYAKY